MSSSRNDAAGVSESSLIKNSSNEQIDAGTPNTTASHADIKPETAVLQDHNLVQNTAPSVVPGVEADISDAAVENTSTQETNTKRENPDQLQVKEPKPEKIKKPKPNKESIKEKLTSTWGSFCLGLVHIGQGILGIISFARCHKDPESLSFISANDEGFDSIPGLNDGYSSRTHTRSHSKGPYSGMENQFILQADGRPYGLNQEIQRHERGAFGLTPNFARSYQVK